MPNIQPVRKGDLNTQPYVILALEIFKQAIWDWRNEQEFRDELVEFFTSKYCAILVDGVGASDMFLKKMRSLSSMYPLYNLYGKVKATEFYV